MRKILRTAVVLAAAACALPALAQSDWPTRPLNGCSRHRRRNCSAATRRHWGWPIASTAMAGACWSVPFRLAMAAGNCVMRAFANTAACITWS